MKFVNLTPHTISIITEGGQIKIEPSGQVARCNVARETIDHIGGIPITKTVFGAVQSLPMPEEGVGLIVSRIVAEAERNRNDLFIPDDTIRDENGVIIGCRSLAQLG